MRVLAVLLAISAATVRGGGFWGGGGESHVVEVLGREQFEAWASNTSLLMAEFYAPWCSHCKKLNVELDAASAKIQHLTGVQIVKIDCTEADNTPLRSKFGVTSFPSLFVLQDGAQMPYTGRRTAAAIADFLIVRNQPAVHQVTDELPRTLSGSLNTAVVAVGRFSEKQMRVFNTVASRQRDIHAFFLAESGAAFNLSDGFLGAISNYAAGHKVTGTEHAMAALAEEEVLEFWLEAELAPVLVRLRPDMVAGEDFGFATSRMPKALVFAPSGGSNSFADTAKAAKKLREAATQYKGQIRAAEVAPEFTTVSEKYGARPEWPPTVLVLSKGETKYRCPSLDSLERCFQDLYAGKLPIFFKSSPPVPHAPGALRELSHDEFSEFRAESTPAVVLFYTPRNRQYARSLVHLMEDLADAFSLEPTLRLAQYNIVSNDPPPGLELVSAFPGWEGQCQVILVRPGAGIPERLPNNSLEDVLAALAVHLPKLQVKQPTRWESFTRTLFRYKAVVAVVSVAVLAVGIMIYAFSQDFDAPPRRSQPFRPRQAEPNPRAAAASEASGAGSKEPGESSGAERTETKKDK